MSGFQSQPINHIRGGCRWSCRSATEAAPLSLPLPLPPLSSGLDTINSSETDRAAIMAATGTETSGMQASCKSTEQTRNTQDRLPTSLSLLYSRVKGHGVPPLRAKAAKHCHKTPQSFTTEEKTGGGGKKLLITLSPSHSPPLGFYKVILAHDARRDTLQHRRSRALPDHHTHEIQQHKSRTTFFYKSKKRREGGTL